MKKLTALLLLAVLLAACSPAADSPETARKYLLEAPAWQIEDVYVNDALSYKDGKPVDTFGGPTFNRYMKSVQFRDNGDFVGQYEGQDDPNVLHWEIDEQNGVIVVTAADTLADNRSGWTIAPQDVRADYFEMTTETAAIDYPRVTSIRLVFGRKEGGD